MINKFDYNPKVYLTFETDQATSEMLKKLAAIDKTNQPKLIDQICREYITNRMNWALEKFEELGIDIEQFKQENKK